MKDHHTEEGVGKPNLSQEQQLRREFKPGIGHWNLGILDVPNRSSTTDNRTGTTGIREGHGLGDVLNQPKLAAAELLFYFHGTNSPLNSYFAAHFVVGTAAYPARASVHATGFATPLTCYGERVCAPFRGIIFCSNLAYQSPCRAAC